MKKLTYIFAIGVFISQFYSCSWIENFYIINLTNEEVIVEIKLQDSIKGTFPIFDYKGATVYAVNKRAKINYEKNSELNYDTLDKFSHIAFKLQPQSAIQIGALHNDKYKSCNQYFINGRVFNLEKIIIKKNEIVIVKNDFDKYFEKDGNGINYIVK